MREVHMEIVFTILLGILLGLLAPWWLSILHELPWSRVSSVILFCALPIVGGVTYARKQRFRGKSSEGQVIRFAAVYWFVMTLLLAFLSGVLQAVRAPETG